MLKNGVFQIIQTRPKTNYKARAWSKMKNYCIFKSKEPQFNGIFLEFVLKNQHFCLWGKKTRAEKIIFKKSLVTLFFNI